MNHLAVIDLGTNTFHLLIAKMDATTLQIIHKEKKPVKIGEGGISQGFISEAAVARALATLKEFRATMDQFKVTEHFAFATSAFRNAQNRDELIKSIKQQTGIDVQVISGEKEATYIYKGVSHALDLGASDNLILDIGGGSVEFIIANDQSIQWKHSFEIGAQRLMDRFHYKDPINAQDILKLEHYLDQELTPLITAMEQYNPRTLIGSSGTFDTLSEIYCEERGIIQEDTPERMLSLEGYRQIHQRIITLDRAQRMQIKGMIEMRVDMIVVASCLIHYLLNRFHIADIRISAFALKEGVLMEVVHRLRQQQRLG